MPGHPRLLGATATGLTVARVPADGNWWDVFNPFAVLASGARRVIADGLIALMVGLWNAGLFVLRLVLTIADAFLTPDLSETGPAATGYRITFWVGGTLVVLLGLVQIGAAVLRRDGRKLGVLAVGFGQYALAWAGSVAYAVTFLAAASGLTRALMQALLGVSSWAQWKPWDAFSVRDVTDGTIAVGLGLLGLFMWIAAFAYLLVLLMRAGALVLLVATGPISAAGLVSDLGSSWFWKSVRWFHAAALTPALMVLTLGLGVQLVTNVPLGYGDDLVTSVGSAFAGVGLILVGVISPVALFKLLAFVDPGTASGAAMRQGLGAVHGVSGLLRTLTGGPGAGGGTSSAASTTDAQGRTSGELAARGAVTNRLTGAGAGPGAGGGAGGAGGFAGAALGVGAAAVGMYAAGMSRVAAAGAAATTVGTDLADQTGIGHNNHYPDYGRWSPATSSTGGDARDGGEGGTADATAPDHPGGGSPVTPGTGPGGSGPTSGPPSSPVPRYPSTATPTGPGSASPRAGQSGGPSFAGHTARSSRSPQGASPGAPPGIPATGIPAPPSVAPSARVARDPSLAGPTGGDAAIDTRPTGETPMTTSTPAPAGDPATAASVGGAL